MPYPPTDMEYQARVGTLRQELQRLGWTRGGNIEFDERWTTDNMDLVRANAANLVELKPDVIVAIGGRVIPVLLQITRTVPIVVPTAVDPVGTGWVKSLARPAREHQPGPNQYLSARCAIANDGGLSGLRRCGEPNVVRTERPGPVSTCRRLRR